MTYPAFKNNLHAAVVTPPQGTDGTSAGVARTSPFADLELGEGRHYSCVLKAVRAPAAADDAAVPTDSEYVRVTGIETPETDDVVLTLERGTEGDAFDWGDVASNADLVLSIVHTATAGDLQQHVGNELGANVKGAMHEVGTQASPLGDIQTAFVTVRNPNNAYSSELRFRGTAARRLLLPDKGGTVAVTSDLSRLDTTGLNLRDFIVVDGGYPYYGGDRGDLFLIRAFEPGLEGECILIAPELQSFGFLASPLPAEGYPDAVNLDVGTFTLRELTLKRDNGTWVLRFVTTTVSDNQARFLDAVDDIRLAEMSRVKSFVQVTTVSAVNVKPQRNFVPPSLEERPGASDDASEGYEVGSVVRFGNALFVCNDATNGAASWAPASLPAEQIARTFIFASDDLNDFTPKSLLPGKKFSDYNLLYFIFESAGIEIRLQILFGAASISTNLYSASVLKATDTTFQVTKTEHTGLGQIRDLSIYGF